MIISNIIGGLGNQMFQYAFGRMLSLSLGVPLKLDVSDFTGYTRHNGFELDRLFNIAAMRANNNDVRTVLGWQSADKVRRLVARKQMCFLRRKTMIVEPHFHFWPQALDIPDNRYIVGHWQTEKYFCGVAEHIRSDFAFKTALTDKNKDLSHQIKSCNSISLHVRRGDYVSDPKTLVTNGVCPTQYYNKAIKLIVQNVDNPNFFIFSDDSDWVRQNMELRVPCFFVDHNNGLESYNDMRLMSLCQHNIIANSSFSWWGAWLNQNSEKMVVSPKQWFANPSLDPSDLIPDDWYKI